jgi:hypothetical protein
MIAPCGLNCQDCAIRKAPFDSNAADEVVSWFQSMGWLKRKRRSPGDPGAGDVLQRLPWEPLAALGAGMLDLSLLR